MMDKFELQRLRDLPIEEVAERVGLEVVRHKCLCPFHDDHHPSLSFNLRKNTYRCFVCGEHGGTIDLVMRCLHKDFKEACRWLGGDGNGTKTITKTKTEAKPSSSLAPLSVADLRSSSSSSSSLAKPSFDARRYERFFERPWLSEAARRFLFEERRLDERVVRWCRLTSWRDRQGVEWLQIPYYDREWRLVGVQWRNLTSKRPTQPPSKGGVESIESPTLTERNLSIQYPYEGDLEGSLGGDLGGLTSSQPSSNVSAGSIYSPLSRGDKEGSLEGDIGGLPLPRFKFPYGSNCGIYNLPVLNRLHEGDELYITEGCSDCWAALSAGHKAIAIPSATLLKPHDLDPLIQLSSSLALSLVMYPDNDEPGERLYLQLKELLESSSSLAPLSVADLRLSLIRRQLPPGCKDYSDYYLALKLLPPSLPFNPLKS